MNHSKNPVLDAWNRADIRYCSFKSNEHIREGLVGDTDLDILIDRNDYDKAAEIMEGCHYRQVEPVDVGSYPNVVNWYGLNSGNDALIHIHLHFELMTGKSLYKDYCLPWREQFLTNRFLDQNTGVYCVSPHYEYVLLCTRLMLKRLVSPRKKRIARDMIAELDYLYERINLDSVQSAVNDLYGAAADDYLADSFYQIQKLSDSEFVKLYDAVKRRMKPNQRASEGFALLRSYANRVIRKLSREYNRRFDKALPLKKRFVKHGLTVAFVGIDGSGKSTVGKEIQKWLGSEFDVKKYYAGAGDGKKDLLAAIALRLYKGSNNGRVSREAAEKKDAQPRKKSLKSQMKAVGSCVTYVRILRSNIRHMRQAEKLRDKGLICLMDRYPQNSMPYVHDGVKIKKYDTGRGIIHHYVLEEERLLESVKEHPFDIVFRLEVDPQVSFARKPEETLESLRYKAETLKQIKFAAKSIVEIDANQPLEEVLRAIKREIWMAL